MVESTEKQQVTLKTFAEKIALYYAKEGLGLLCSLIFSNHPRKALSKLRGQRIHFLSPKTKRIGFQKKSQFKSCRALSPTDLKKTKPLSESYKALFHAASGAQKCCGNQDLHLFNLRRVYHENKLGDYEVIDWKLSPAFIAESAIRQYVTQLKSVKKVIYNERTLELIVFEDKEEEEEEELSPYQQLQQYQTAKPHAFPFS